MANKLYEYISPDRGSFIVEGSPDGRDVCMKGIFIQADKRNQNQRIYPNSEITNAVRLIKEKIVNGETVLGELDHPPELTINLDRVSHMITDMWMEGSDGYGKLKIIDKVPMGQIARGLVESGVKLGVSSRGSGNVDFNGIVSEFEIVTVDIVAQPSAPNAYPKSIYESLFNMKGGEAIHRIAQAAAFDMNDPRAKFHLKQEVIKFVNELRK